MDRNPTSFDRNIYLERRFTPQIKEILGSFFITQDVFEDRRNATDFLTFTIKPFRVAARLRRFEYYQKYPTQFTIRYSLPSGAKTEIHKIHQGKVDYILYGFIDGPEVAILQYFIGDLEVFREAKVFPVAVIPNNPHDSDMAVYEVDQFPDAFIVDSVGMAKQLTFL